LSIRPLYDYIGWKKWNYLYFHTHGEPHYAAESAELLAPNRKKIYKLRKQTSLCHLGRTDAKGGSEVKMFMLTCQQYRSHLLRINIEG